MSLPETPAGRLALLEALFFPRPVYDDDGQQVGEAPPVFEASPEELRKLLEMPLVEGP